MNFVHSTGAALLLALFFTAGSAVAGSSKKAEPTEQAPARINSRYVINGGEVYDKKTDLTWQRCSVGMRWKEGAGCVGVPRVFTWDEAQKQGGNGWRVPDKVELATLIDQQRKAQKKSPTIDLEAFPDLADADASMVDYWSSTESTASGAWLVFFNDGSVHYNGRSYTYAVRLVRGGQ